MKALHSSRLVTILAAALAFTFTFGACSSKKAPDGGPSATSQGQAAKLSCEGAEVADASGKTKKALAVLPTLYDSKVSDAAKSTIPSFQATFRNASGSFVVRGPNLANITLIVNDVQVAQTPIHTPILTAVFSEQGGKLVLLAGTYAGLTVYDVTASQITERSRYTQWGEVRGISVLGDQIYLIANAGKALIRTTLSGLESKECGSLLYDSAEHLGGTGKPKDLLYVAAAKDGVYAFARTVPAYRFDLVALWTLLKTFLTSAPTNIDLRSMEGELFFIAADGTAKPIQPSVGNYNRFLVSDLTQWTESRVIVGFWAVKDSTWQSFSTAPLAPVLTKLAWAIKLFAESKSGGIILEKGEVKKSMILDGVTLPSPLTLGGVPIEELPHFSLAIAPSAAIDGNRYFLKGVRALSAWDLSQVDDANVVSLPLTEYPSGTPNMPRGYYSSFKTLGDKLFLDGYGDDGSGSRLQNNYNLTAQAALAAPYEGYKAKINFSIDMLPIGVLRNNVFVIKSGKYRRQNVFDANDKTDITLSPPSGYGMNSFPAHFASPAGEAQDQVGFAYTDATNFKLAIELKRPKDGTVLAKVENIDVVNATESASLSSLALSDTLAMAAVNVPAGGWYLKAFRIDTSVSPGNLVPLEKDTAGGTTNVAESATGKVLSVKGLVKNGNLHSVLLLTLTGVQHNLEKVDFSHEANTNLFTAPAKSTVGVAPPVGDVVADATHFYLIDKTGTVTAYDRGNFTSRVVGKLSEDPAEKLSFGFTSLGGNQLYLTGFSNQQLFKLFRIDLATGKATSFNRHNYLIGHASDQIFVGLDLTGGGLEAFKL